MTRRALRAVAAATLLAVAGCAGPDGEPAAGAGDGPRGQVTVFAAASLTEVFAEIGERFSAGHPGTTVTFSFGASSALARQIAQGAPADLFAAASPETMAQIGAEAAGEPRVFARNTLVIAVPKDNPARIAGVADLARPGVTVALCASQVPCGAAARRALDAAGVRLQPVTLEQDVKAALTKVRLGEVDAALVYRTDAAAAAADVTGIEFPDSARAVNDYPVVALRAAANRAGADAFVAYLSAEPARTALAAAGFALP